MNIVERLKEYVRTTAAENEQPHDNQSKKTNRFSYDQLWSMFPDEREFNKKVRMSGMESYPEDLLFLMSEGEILEAYARWCIEEENHESS